MATWDEGSVVEEVAHVKNVEQHQEEETTKLFKIPPKFEEGRRLLLQASDADFERGVVREIKCRLCPKAKFKNFQQFSRHCDFTEAHPLLIHFCDRCGDFFACPDSLVRHGKQRPRECRKVTAEMAAQKHRDTQEAYEEFIRKLEYGLKTRQDIGKLFCGVIKDRYPKSSKKRKGSGNEQSRR